MVAVAAPVAQSSRQAVAAAVIGNVLEWYDFGVYGFMAAVIGRNFFPSGNAVFGLGFVARPLGGIVIGRLGDTRGRKAALVLCILTMAVGTVLIGLIPPYAAIGVAAPVLVLVARLLQGFSAGGEWGGSTAFLVEWADEGERGFLTSFQQASVMTGLLLGSGIAALVSTLAHPVPARRPPRPDRRLDAHEYRRDARL
jgi:MFS transporter, MHS family, proline/betaine transporter